MTPKENYLKVLKGEIPEWLPIDTYTFYPPWFTPGIICIRPEIFNIGRMGGTDFFGVKFITTESTGGQGMPDHSQILLKDIHDWPNVIKLPDINEFDFEEMARKDLARVDRSQTAVELGTHVGYFQLLMEFMGMTEGLIAMYEEPEEVYNLMEYLADWLDEFFKRSIDAYKPDVYAITDDIASSQSTFMSKQVYRDLIKPFHVRMCEHANQLGIPIDMHCCGHCEDFIEEWFDFNVIMWNCCQWMNDLEGIKKKYGNRLILNRCNSLDDPQNFSDANEEDVRACIRKYIDTFAPGGGYIFGAYVFGPRDDETIPKRNMWMMDEYKKYGIPWYKNHS